MIYVTVGTAVGGGEFDRLIKKMDDIALSLTEEVLIQTGASRLIPKNAKYLNYASYEQSLEYFRTARLVVGHCGSGTIINALSFGCNLILVPRKFEFSEHSDDHQLEIAKYLEKKSLARIIYDVKDLDKAIDDSTAGRNTGAAQFSSASKNDLICNMRRYLAGESAGTICAG